MNAAKTATRTDRSQSPMPPPVWVTTLVFATLHVILAAWLWLTHDEAYYALWATHLAPMYYDHPPMIALWIRLGEAVLGTTTLGVRLVSIIGCALVTPVTAAIARALGADERTARWAALMFNGMLVPFALGFIATPDAPSTLFWALATLVLIRAPEAKGRGYWLIAGLLLALGVLSKLTNLFLGVGLTLWLLATREGRAQLRRPIVWIAAALTLAILAPFLWWSATHDWLGLALQFGRLDRAAPGHNRTLEFLAGSLLTITPLIARRAAVSVWMERGPPRRLVWFGAPMVLYLLVHSLHHSIQPNWIAPLFPGLAVLAAFGCEKARISRAMATGVALSLTVLIMVLAFWPGRPMFQGNNPPNQTKGWPALTRQLAGFAKDEGADWIAAVEYGSAGELAFALQQLPVHAVTDPQRWGFRGPFPRALCGKRALLIQMLPQARKPDALFTTIGETQIFDRQSAGYTLKRYAATVVSGVKGFPCKVAKD